MPNRKFTRVGLKTPEGGKKLFRFFELKDGSLCFEIVPTKHIRDGVRPNVATTIRYQKFSIHPSPNIEGICTITFGQDGDGANHSVHVSSEALDSGMSVHLISKRFSDCRSEQYILKPRQEQRVISEVNLQEYCLFGHFYARKSSAAPVKPMNKEQRLWSFQGELFSVDFFFGLLPFRSLDSDWIFMMSGAPRGDLFKKNDEGKPIGIRGADFKDGASLSVDMIEQVLIEEYFCDFLKDAKQPNAALEVMNEIYKMVGLGGNTLSPYKRAGAQKLYLVLDQLN